MRPKSVVLAEWLYLASIAVLLLISILTWNDAVAQGGVVLAGGVNAFGIGLSLLLLILTTRKASRIALWFLVVLTALGAIGVMVQVSKGILATGLIGVLTIAQLVLALIPIVLLFRPRARAWFAEMAYRGDDEVGDEVGAHDGVARDGVGRDGVAGDGAFKA